MCQKGECERLAYSTACGFFVCVSVWFILAAWQGGNALTTQVLNGPIKKSSVLCTM